MYTSLSNDDPPYYLHCLKTNDEKTLSIFSDERERGRAREKEGLTQKWKILTIIVGNTYLFAISLLTYLLFSSLLFLFFTAGDNSIYRIYTFIHSYEKSNIDHFLLIY